MVRGSCSKKDALCVFLALQTVWCGLVQKNRHLLLAFHNRRLLRTVVSSEKQKIVFADFSLFNPTIFSRLIHFHIVRSNSVCKQQQQNLSLMISPLEEQWLGQQFVVRYFCWLFSRKQISKCSEIGNHHHYYVFSKDLSASIHLKSILKPNVFFWSLIFRGDTKDHPKSFTETWLEASGTDQKLCS